MNICELRKKLLRQSSIAQRICAEKRQVSYQFGASEWQRSMNNRIDSVKKPFIDTENFDSDSIYQRFFLTPNEKKLLQDIYLSDFDDLIDFDE